ncbi:MAG: hypothetical protein O2958_11390, partial [Gemmatimonadetes bacterium]|nr:hypothetical protein [Gemmatimonadota bacterium]
MTRINWGQALAEVLLLLLGIGLALVVDQRRDRAQERATERAHLVALKVDFETADSALSVRLDAIREQLSHNEALLETLAGPVGSVPGDSIAALLRKAFADVQVGVTIPSYEDLMTSGELGLLRSEQLRRALAEFHTNNEAADGFSQKAAEQWAGPVTDFFAKELNVTAIYGPHSEVRWMNPGMPVFPGYANNPHVARVAVPDEAYWNPVLVNRIAVKNITLDDTSQHLRL